MAGGRPIAYGLFKKWKENFIKDPSNPEGIRGFGFDREVYDKLLRQPNVTGIQNVLLKDDEGNIRLAIVGLGPNNEAIMAKSMAAPDVETGEIYDFSYLCPPHCPKEE